MEYLRGKYPVGMTDADLLSGKAHIDHARPLASFDLTTEAGIQAGFHYTNLQPMWAQDNLRKSAKPWRYRYK